MREMVHLLRALVFAVTFVVAPLLPQGIRARWPWPEILARPGLEALNAFLHAVAGVVFWAAGLVAYQTRWSDWMTAALWSPDLNVEEVSLQHFGMLGFFSYLVSLEGILLTLVLADGIARVVGMAAAGTPPGSFFVWAATVLLSRGKEALDERVRTARYGRPDEPDRYTVSGDSLVVRCNRPHETWHSALTYSHGDRLYRLVEKGEGRDADRACHVYRFGAWPENNMIRKIVLLEPPEEDPGRAGPGL